MRLIKKKLECLPIPERQFIVDKHYEVKAEKHRYEDGEITVATIWYSNNDMPTCRVFIADTSYITLKCIGESQWTDASIGYLVGNDYMWWYRTEEKYKVYADGDTMQLLKDLSQMKSDETSALKLIDYRQTKIRQKKIQDREDREQAVWDAELSQTPEEPKELEAWIKDKVFVKERYIFYETSKAADKRGMCTYCNKEVTFHKPRHGEKGICLSCGSKVEYKNGNKQRCIDSSSKYIKVHQMTTRDNVIMREYRCIQKISVNAWNDFAVNQRHIELERVFVNKFRDMKTYVWDKYKNKKMRWIPTRTTRYGTYGFYERQLNFFEDYENIMNALKGGFEYLPRELFDEPVDYKRLLKMSVGMIERLWKMGLKNLARSLTGQYCQYTNEHALFKSIHVENDDMAIFKAVDITYTELQQWDDMKKTGKRLTADNILQLRQAGISIAALAAVNKYASNDKVIRYLVEQKDTADTSTYKDYLNLLKELRMDMTNDFVLFPRCLRARHDELVDIKNELANKRLKKKLDKTQTFVDAMEAELNEKYGVKTKNYFIRAPHSAYEIVVEGQKLNHCVGGNNYREKIKRGESFILFVRKKSEPDIPWWTIEVGANHTIRQYHGWGNRDKDKADVEPIINKLRKRLEKLKYEENQQKEAIAAAV